MIGPDNSDPYDEGLEARLAGYDETKNPYNPYNPDIETDDHLSWNDGWNSADDEEE